MKKIRIIRNSDSRDLAVIFTNYMDYKQIGLELIAKILEKTETTLSHIDNSGNAVIMKFFNSSMIDSKIITNLLTKLVDIIEINISNKEVYTIEYEL